MMTWMQKSCLAVFGCAVALPALAGGAFHFDGSSAAFQAHVENLKKNYSDATLEIMMLVDAEGNQSSVQTSTQGLGKNLSINAIQSLTLHNFAALAYTRGALGKPFDFTYRIYNLDTGELIDKCVGSRVVNSYGDLANYDYTLDLTGEQSCGLKWVKG